MGKPGIIAPDAPSALSMEQHGVNEIPVSERAYRPYHIVATMYGSNLSYSAIIFGSFPILFGLGWWDSVTSILVGCLLGGLVLAPMGFFGPKTGTNNAVSSGAHFGVAGRFIGTAIALFSALGFVSLTIWTGGDALSASVARFAGTGSEWAWQAAGYGVLAVFVLIVCVRGIHMVIRLQERLMMPVMSLVLLVGVFAFWGDFDTGYAGGKLLLGSFTPTWIASTIVVSSLIVSYAGFVGDWARYIHPDTPPPRLFGATWLSGLSVAVPILWGAFITSTFPDDAGAFVNTLVANSPSWYIVGLLLLAMLAGVAQGAIGLYGTGLDASSLIPRLSRPQATVLIAVVSTTLVYLGAFVFDALAIVEGFLALLLIVSGPWVVIMALGYWHTRGYYFPNDLQVFTHGQRGGRYWFSHGWNWRATAAWLVASFVGLLFGTAAPIFTGPFANAIGGVDISFVLALAVGGLLYIALLYLSPSPAYIFGPAGPRFGRVREDAVPAALSESLSAGVLAPKEAIVS